MSMTPPWYPPDPTGSSAYTKPEPIPALDAEAWGIMMQAAIKNQNSISSMIAIIGFMRECGISEHSGIDVLAQLIHNYAFIIHTGTWKYVTKHDTDSDDDKEEEIVINDNNIDSEDSEHSDIMYSRESIMEETWTKELKITENWTFILSKAWDYVYEESGGSAWGKWKDVRFNGYLKMIEPDKYLMLFDEIEAERFMNKQDKGVVAFWKETMEFDHKQRENIYTQRVVQLYKQHNKLNHDEIKNLHKEYIKCDPDEYENYKLEWNVIANKLKKDFREKLTTEPEKEDIHFLYQDLCNHFGIEAEKIYIGELYVNFAKNEEYAVIELDNDGIFRGRNKLRKTVQ